MEKLGQGLFLPQNRGPTRPIQAASWLSAQKSGGKNHPASQPEKDGDDKETQILAPRGLAGQFGEGLFVAKAMLLLFSSKP